MVALDITRGPWRYQFPCMARRYQFPTIQIPDDTNSHAWPDVPENTNSHAWPTDMIVIALDPFPQVVREGHATPEGTSTYKLAMEELYSIGEGHWRDSRIGGTLTGERGEALAGQTDRRHPHR